MAYSTLPQLKKNSAPTTLSSGIDASTLTIPVAELSRFHDKDGNLIPTATIGYLDPAKAEGIRPVSASATSGPGTLTTSARGIRADGTIGAAAPWPSNTEIAATFSIDIYEWIRENFESLNTLVGGKLAATGAANGKIYIGKADGTFALVNLTEGANVTITNEDGVITISSSGGGDFLVGQIFS